MVIFEAPFVISTRPFVLGGTSSVSSVPSYEVS